jgi:integrase/recombinase XerC
MATEIEALLASWRRDLRARNLATRTVETYTESARQLIEWLAETGITDPGAVERDHVAGFISHLLETKSAATASVRYRGLQQFFNWLVNEEELDVSPMAKMKPPVVPDKEVSVLSDDQLKALFATCSGKDFVDRRDAAILRLFADTGMRLAEMANLRVQDVDLDDQIAVVLGKGRRPRTVPFGNKTTTALDRYIRIRARHKRADEPALWLGSNNKQPMTINGVGQVVRKRGRQAGIDDLHPHMLRHSFASRWLHQGGQEVDLMRLTGWKSRTMVARYGAAAADQRAKDAFRRLGLGDQF